MSAPAGPPVTVVVGTGLVGASIGHALSAEGWRVHLVDAVPSHAVVAAGLGAGSAAPADPGEVGLVVVAVPPRAIAAPSTTNGIVLAIR